MHSAIHFLPPGPHAGGLSRRAWLAALAGWGWGAGPLGAQPRAPDEVAALPPVAPVAEAGPRGWAPPPEVILASHWRPGQSPHDWLVSEKYDGVRGYWDGEVLRLRSGHVVAAPAAFLAHLPAGVALDGELWMGRNQFDALSTAVRRATPQPQEWQAIRFMVFELPQAGGTFACRYDQLCQQVARANHPALQAVAQRRVADTAALDAWLAEVVAAGGEGLVLHHAQAPYLTGRQAVLAKYKPVQDDEAVVLGHLPGHGRLTGKVGALRVRNTQGQEFTIGTGLNDAQREHPPAVGTRITYAWRGLTAHGLPRFASFVRVRPEGL